MDQAINEYYQPLFHFINKRVNNRLDAEDLSQEVFYKLIKSQNDKVNNLKSWVYTVAKNVIIDYYRKKKNLTEDVDFNSIISDNSEEEKKAVEDLSDCIAPVINRLPYDYQQIIRMSELEGVPQKEIAEKLGINYTTVRSKVQRGRKKMKELYIRFCGDVLQEGLMGYNPESCGSDPNSGCETKC